MRLPSPETIATAAMETLFEHYSVLAGGWRNVALLYDDSLWARESAENFADALGGMVDVLGGGACVGGGCDEWARDGTTRDPLGVSFSLARWDGLRGQDRENAAAELVETMHDRRADLPKRRISRGRDAG